jgi:hypothetical protein
MNGWFVRRFRKALASQQCAEGRGLYVLGKHEWLIDVKIDGPLGQVAAGVAFADVRYDAGVGVASNTAIGEEENEHSRRDDVRVREGCVASVRLDLIARGPQVGAHVLLVGGHMAGIDRAGDGEPRLVVHLRVDLQALEVSRIEREGKPAIEV